jgi:hypothetical protein
MGMESFGVTYTNERSPDVEIIKCALTDYGVSRWSTRKDDEFEGVLSSKLPIEVKIWQLDARASHMSFRFALVNPPAIDDEFFEIVNWSVERWPGELKLMSSLEMETPLPSYEWKFKRAEVLREIELLRKQWFEICGGDYMVSSVAEAVAEMLKRIRARNP